MKSIVVDNLRASIAATAKEEFADDPKGVLKAYFDSLALTMANVVSDGYDSKAKKNSCKGVMTIATASGQTFTKDYFYSTQTTEDKANDFVVTVDAFVPMIQAVGADLRKHYMAKRYGGNWTGAYACDGIQGAVDGPQGPFTSEVTLVVDQYQNGKLERTTKGGGYEVLSGTVSQEVVLTGKGRNSPDDAWVTHFDGAVQGSTLKAKGNIMLDENQPLRACTLSLTSS